MDQFVEGIVKLYRCLSGFPLPISQSLSSSHLQLLNSPIFIHALFKYDLRSWIYIPALHCRQVLPTYMAEGSLAGQGEA